MEQSELFDVLFDNFKKLFFPEEWISLDLSMSKSELFALLQIDRNGEIIMSQIADYVGIPMSTATGLVERLVKKGYIERTRSESDRRIVSIRLTDKGRSTAAEIKQTIGGMAGRILDALTEEERTLLFSVFAKLADAISTISKGRNAPEEGDVHLRKIEIE